MTLRMDENVETLQKQEVVFRDLMRAIRSGKLAPGTRLPNEFDLAQKYAVSRNSVRRGLMRLQNEGLVEKRHGSGSYVLPMGRLRAAAKRETIIVVRYVPQTLDGRIAHAIGPWRSVLREGMAYGAGYHNVHLLDDLYGVGASHVMSSMSSEPLSGFMVAAFDYDNPSEMMADLPQDVPKLIVNRVSADPGIPYITIDRESGVYQATSFLLTLGHRRIGIDCTGGGTPPMIDRLRGYRRAFEAVGLPVDETMFFKGTSSSDYQEWPSSLHNLLKKTKRPTALIMHYDNQILHVMEVIQSHGLRVPRDISLIIIDDGPLLLRVTPRISAISEPYGEMGRRAVGMILAYAKGGQTPQNVVLEPQLVMRESVLSAKA